MKKTFQTSKDAWIDFWHHLERKGKCIVVSVIVGFILAFGATTFSTILYWQSRDAYRKKIDSIDSKVKQVDINETEIDELKEDVNRVKRQAVNQTAASNSQKSNK